MAEGILKHLQGRRIYVDSVGVHQGEIDPFAIAVMDEIGIDLRKHRSKTFRDLEDSSYDLVISLSPGDVFYSLERGMSADLSKMNAPDQFMHFFRTGDWARLRAELANMPADLARKIYDKILADLTPQKRKTQTDGRATQGAARPASRPGK